MQVEKWMITKEEIEEHSFKTPLFKFNNYSFLIRTPHHFMNINNKFRFSVYFHEIRNRERLFFYIYSNFLGNGDLQTFSIAISSTTMVASLEFDDSIGDICKSLSKDGGNMDIICFFSRQQLGMPENLFRFRDHTSLFFLASKYPFLFFQIWQNIESSMNNFNLFVKKMNALKSDYSMLNNYFMVSDKEISDPGFLMIAKFDVVENLLRYIGDEIEIKFPNCFYYIYLPIKEYQVFEQDSLKILSKICSSDFDCIDAKILSSETILGCLRENDLFLIEDGFLGRKVSFHEIGKNKKLFMFQKSRNNDEILLIIRSFKAIREVPVEFENAFYVSGSWVIHEVFELKGMKLYHEYSKHMFAELDSSKTFADICNSKPVLIMTESSNSRFSWDHRTEYQNIRFTLPVISGKTFPIIPYHCKGFSEIPIFPENLQQFFDVFYRIELFKVYIGDKPNPIEMYLPYSMSENNIRVFLGRVFNVSIISINKTQNEIRVTKR